MKNNKGWNPVFIKILKKTITILSQWNNLNKL